jgi:hypothetical protein
MKFIYIYSFLCVFLCSSCLSELQIDLGNEYTFIASGNAMEVSTYQGNAISYKNYIYNPIIFSDIVDYKFDDNFIIGKSLYHEDDNKVLLEFNLSVNYNEHLDYSRNDSMVFVKRNSSKNPHFKARFIDSVFFDNIKTKHLKKYENDSVFQESLITDGINEKLINDLMKTNPILLKMKKQKINFFIIDKINHKYFIDLNENKFKTLSKQMGISLELSK